MSHANTPLSSEQVPKSKRATLFGRNKNAKMRRLLQRGSNLDANRKANTLRMRTNAVLLTGGLLVRKEGHLLVKKDGFGNQFHKKRVILEEGVLKIFDCPKLSARSIKKKPVNSKKLIISSDQRREIMDRDSKAEFLIELGQIKSLEYNKRMGKQFELTWRRTSNKKSSRRSNRSRGSLLDKNENGSQVSKTSRFSRLSKALAVTGGKKHGSLRGHQQKHFSLLNPKTWLSSQERSFQFKASNGREGDVWVQCLLYEIKNQAVCIKEAILSQQNLRQSPDPSHLDNLHRQHVDLWALAKGKISIKTKEALEDFVQFLENEVNKSSPQDADDLLSVASFGDELNIWKDMLSNITDLVDLGVNTVETGHEVQTGLEELQILNEEEFHCKKESFRDVPKFHATTRVLNPANEITVNVSGTGSFLRKNLRKTRKFSKGEAKLELNDIVMLTPESRQRTVEVEKSFPSAVDVRRNKEHQEEAKILSKIAQSEENTTQLQELSSQH